MSLKTPHRTRALCVAAVAAATFLVALFLFTRANTYPFVYHPDEPSKAEQVVSGTYNFNHPQLVLRATQAAVVARTGDLRGRTTDDEPWLVNRQRIVESGRWASAAFGALAAAVLAGWTCARRGVFAGSVAGVALATCPPLLANAHYLKEDTTFAFTVAVWVVAATWHLRERSRASLVTLGVACGLALCGKWIGITLTLAGVAVALAVTPRPRASLLLAAAAGIGTWLVVNLPMLWQFGNLVAGLRHEAAHVATGHQGLILPRLPTYAGELWLLGPVALGLAAYEVARSAWRRDQRGWWVMPVVAAGLLGLVMLSHVVSPRYALPTVVLLTTLAAWGTASLAADLRQRVSKGAAFGVAAMLAAAFVVQGGLRSLDYLHTFATDTRITTRMWVQTFVPADARVLADEGTGLWLWDLPPGSRRVALPLAERPADAWAADGFTHVVVSDSSYGGYFVNGVRFTPDHADTADVVRERYAALLAGEPVMTFTTNRRTPPHMGPTIRVFTLDTGGASR